MKTKDFNAQFERLKKFKEEHSDFADSDEFFKSIYTKFRKNVKKWNKVLETQEKIQKGKEATKDQKDMLNKKKELENSLIEMVTLNGQYMDNYDKQIELILAKYQKKEPIPEPEETKEEVEDKPEEVEEPQPEPEEQEPPIDIEAIRKEEYDRGFEEGRQAGYKDGEANGFESGKNDGYSQAKQEFEADTQEQSTGDASRAVSYFSLIHVFGAWMDTYAPFSPPFKRSDYFSEEEYMIIKQIFMSNLLVQPPINFSRITSGLKDRVMKLLEREDVPIQSSNSITYKQLAESFDRVLENHQFKSTDHTLLPVGDMMGGMFGQPHPNMMAGQMFGNFNQVPPPQMQVDPQMNIAPKIESNIGAYNSTQDQQVINQIPVAETSIPEPVTDTPVEEEPIAQDTGAQIDEVLEEKPTEKPVEETAPEEAPVQKDLNSWKDDDIDEDDDDDEDYDNYSDNEDEDKPEEGKTEQVADKAAEAPQDQPSERKVDDFYEEKQHVRRGRGGHYRGGHYNDRGYSRGYRGNNYRGRGNYNRGYRGNRRGGYRHDRGGRGRDHYYDNNRYYEERDETKQEESPVKVDEDGFNVVHKKTYPKKKKRTNHGGMRGKPKPNV